MSNPLSENRLLAALPAAERARLVARMTDVSLVQKQVVYHPGGPIDAVYFPRAGMLSAVVVMADGATAEVAIVGNEGMLGAPACLGADRSAEQVICQVEPCECRQMPAAEFITEVQKGGPLRDAVHRYLWRALVASARHAACNGLHSVEERFARWLLHCHDRVGADDFPMTHEFLSTMLGVRRATVTVIAGSLQTAGIITYKSGRLTVVDRARLEDAACECYAVIREADLPAP